MATNSAAATCGRSQRCTPPPPVQNAAAPWLVFQYGKGMKSQAFYNICDPSNKTCRKSIPELRCKLFWQKPSHRNWLITLCEDKSYKSIYNSDIWNLGDCFLWNPVSSESIQLPSLLEWISRPKKYVLIDCVLTSPPSRHCHGDSTVVFLFSTPFNKKDDVLFLSVRACSYVLRYVGSNDDIFKIWVCFNNKECKQILSIHVWRLDFSCMKWEEMNDLGDHVIFTGINTGFCCSAAKLGFQSGGLYYTFGDDKSLYKFEVNGGNAAILPCLKLPTPWFPLEWIMMMPEDGRKRMENDGKEEEQQQQQQKDFILKEVVEENKICKTTNINRSCDKEEIGPWDILNEDTVSLISNYLHPLDYVHFRSVCKANRRVMPPTTQRRGSNSTRRPFIFPWLMFPRYNTYNFVDPVHDNEAYLMGFCELLQGATIRYQKDGWVLMSREKSVFFYNPFTREIIKLPDLPDDYSISNICFDYSPATPDCIVFAIDQTPIDTGILTIMRGDDLWLACPFPNTNVEIKLMTLHGTAPIFYKNVYYCVDCYGTLGAYDILEKDACWRVLARPKKIFDNDMLPNLLVECGGDLLLVKLGHHGTAVRIFRLDFSKMEWVKVESLGKHMLFISETSCLSAIAPNSQMQNTICFPRVYLNGGGILLYSLETGSYYSSSSAKNQHSLNNFYETEGWLSNCTWIQPNWSKSTEQELDWLNPLC